MRILVIAIPRSGSTSFSKKIALDNDLSFVFEPFAPNAKQFNKFKNFDTDYNKENVVVKTLVNDEHNIDQLINLSKKFDVVYLLSRINLIKCAESWAYLNHKRNEIDGFDFESEYFWEETPNYQECLEQIKRWDNKLKKLSNKLSKEILYYEDIFISNDGKLRKGDKKFNRRLI